MNRSVSAFVLLSMFGLSAMAEEIRPLAEPDLAVVIGDDWTGTLTYLNYGEPVKDVTIPAEIDVIAVEGGLKLSFQYPDEPHANQTMITKVSADGATLNGETIIANAAFSSDRREVRTISPCEDMGRAASCEMIYTLSPTEFELRKMVTYQGETEAFRRNVYAFVR